MSTQKRTERSVGTGDQAEGDELVATAEALLGPAQPILAALGALPELLRCWRYLHDEVPGQMDGATAALSELQAEIAQLQGQCEALRTTRDKLGEEIAGQHDMLRRIQSESMQPAGNRQPATV